MDKLKLEHLQTEGPGQDDLRNLYSWTFEDAVRAHKEWKGSAREGKDPFERWMGTQDLMDLYDEYAQGDPRAILDALYICMKLALPVPRWCAAAFVEGYHRVQNYEAKRWDDVFGKPHPKGTHAGTKQQERENRQRVYSRIQEIKTADSSIPLDGALFEQVGRELAIGGKTTTERFYYAGKSHIEPATIAYVIRLMTRKPIKLP